jgi:hypothetical protein
MAANLTGAMSHVQRDQRTDAARCTQDQQGGEL